ncbi:cell division protein FtsA [Moraxella marmotae]|uniref:cell division protein FtsA n=1 Tax=Moraxella marmotae TaxID=3344520 RepID=UPI0035F2884C
MTLQVVIHISSTAVCTAVGQFETKGSDKLLKITAVGLTHTDAFFGGRVINREYLLSAIHKSVREASNMAGLQIISAALCISSPSMQSRNMFKQVAINSPDCTITQDHIQQAIDAMIGEVARDERTIFQLNRQLVFLDDYHVQDALGLSAKKIGVASHAIDMPTHQLEQIIGMIEQDDLHVETHIFDGIAGAEYALTLEEKQKGVCFIDIGASTTKVCIYKDGVLIDTHCIEMGGVMVDMDIAKECGIALSDAESFKRQEGTLNRNKHSPAAVVTYKKHSKQEKTMLRRELNQVIEARYRKLLDEVMACIDPNLLVSLDAGVVLAGGGALMDGLLTFACNHIGIKARMIRSNPVLRANVDHLADDDIRVLNEHIANNTLHTAIGALLYMGSEQFARDQQTQEVDAQADSWLAEQIGAVSSMFGRFVAWVKRVL